MTNIHILKKRKKWIEFDIKKAKKNPKKQLDPHRVRNLEIGKRNVSKKIEAMRASKGSKVKVKIEEAKK